MYKVEWTEKAKKQLAKLDKPTAEKIRNKVKNHLVKDPFNLGKPLLHAYKGLYRYKIGDYRVVYQIRESELLIIVATAGHRKDIYWV